MSGSNVRPRITQMARINRVFYQRNPCNPRFYLLFLAACVFVIGCRSNHESLPAVAGPTTSHSFFKKPLVAYFSGYEKFRIDDEFIPQTGAYIDTRFGGDHSIDLSHLSNYSALLLGNRAGRPLTAEGKAPPGQW